MWNSRSIIFQPTTTCRRPARSPPEPAPHRRRPAGDPQPPPIHSTRTKPNLTLGANRRRGRQLRRPSMCAHDRANHPEAGGHRGQADSKQNPVRRRPCPSHDSAHQRLLYRLNEKGPPRRTKGATVMESGQYRIARRGRRRARASRRTRQQWWRRWRRAAEN